VVHFEQENVFFWGTFYIISGVDFLSFHIVFYKLHKINFLFQNVLFVTTIFDHCSVLLLGTRSNINYKKTSYEGLGLLEFGLLILKL
jgi:hypothetical protein